MSVTPVLAILVAIGCGLALVAVAIIVVLRIRPTVYAAAGGGGGGAAAAHGGVSGMAAGTAMGGGAGGVVVAGVNGLNGGGLRVRRKLNQQSVRFLIVVFFVFLQMSKSGPPSSFIRGATHLPLSQRDPDELFDMEEKEPDLIPTNKGAFFKKESKGQQKPKPRISLLDLIEEEEAFQTYLHHQQQHGGGGGVGMTGGGPASATMMRRKTEDPGGADADRRNRIRSNFSRLVSQYNKRICWCSFNRVRNFFRNPEPGGDLCRVHDAPQQGLRAHEGQVHRVAGQRGAAVGSWGRQQQRRRATATAAHDVKQAAFHFLVQDKVIEEHKQWYIPF